MQALGMLPPMYGLVLCVFCAVMLLYYMVKGESRNRLGMFAFFIFCLGGALFFLLEHLGVGFTVSNFIIKSTSVLSFLLLVAGARVSYQKSNSQQQAEWRYVLRKIALVFLSVIICIGVLNILQELMR